MFILNSKIKYDYDEEEDILYVSIGKPKPSITKEIEEGILLRYDIEKGNLNGVTILDYMERIENGEEINLPKEIDLSGLKIKN